jgi:hypothetical protein
MTKLSEPVEFLLNKIEHMGMQEALCDPEGLEELEMTDPELYKMVIDYRKNKIGIDRYLKQKYNWVYKAIVNESEDDE